MKLQNTFIEGKMNKDIDERLIPKGQYVHAENIRLSTSEGADGGAIENVLGNEQLTQFTFGANPICINMYADSFSDSIFWFVASDSGSFVCEYNEKQGTYSQVLVDTRAGDDNVLNFNKDYIITGVNVIVDSDNNVLFLLWTDNFNPPRMINVSRAKTYTDGGFDDADISLIKAPPLSPPVFSLSSTVTDEENNLEERFLRFATRFEYTDGEKSAMSSFTEVAFKAKPFQYDYSTSSNESMINDFNEVILSFNTGGENVKNVDILFKESGSSDVFLVESYVKSEQGWVDNTNVNINFINDKVYQKLPEKQLFRLYDAVPLLAKAQEMIGNRIVFGNYTADYNIEDCNGSPIAIDFSLEKVSTAISNLTPTESLKTTRNYEVVQVYLDAQGRMTTGLPSKNNTLHIPNIDCDKQNQIKVNVVHKAPCFAEKFRFFLKQSRYDYDTIVPTLFYQDGVYVWIKVESNDISKVAEGDYLYVKSDSQGIVSPIVQTRVLETKTQPRNFLEDASETSTLQVAGKYFKIKPFNFRVNEEDFDQYSNHSNWRSLIASGTNNFNTIEKAVYYGVGGLNDLSEGGTFIGTDDIRYKIEINNTVSSPDEFRWSKDDGQTWSADIPITGTAQILDGDGVEITFGDTDNHDDNDSWIVSAKSKDAVGYNPTGGIPFASFKSISAYGSTNAENINVRDRILGGARILIRLNSFDHPTNLNFELEKTSSRQYDNIEEWFYGDNIMDDLVSQGIFVEDVFFRRITYAFINTATQWSEFTQSITGDMALLIRIEDQVNDTRGNAWIEIFQSENNIIFETKEILESSDIFYEIGRTYDIDENQNHLGFDGGDINQTVGVNGEFILPVFNCFAWGNGFESYKIKDAFNAVSFKIDTRVSGIVDKYRQNKRIASLTYGEVYEQSTNYNGLNEFNLSLANFKDMDDKYNSIQKIFSKDTDLTIFQEDKVHKVLYQKDILFNADGTGNVTSSNEVLGQEIPFAGEFGISTEPESHAVYGNFEYWTDTKRGVVCRKGMDGITEISRNGMTDWFRDNFRENSNTKKVGAYDVYHDEYIMVLDDVIKEDIYTIACGTSVSKYKAKNNVEFYVNVEPILGNITIDYSTDTEVNIQIHSNGVQTDTLGLTGTGSFIFEQTVLGISTIKVVVVPVGVEPTFTVGVSCVVPIVVVVAVDAIDDTVLVITGNTLDINVLQNDIFVDPVTVTVITPAVEGTASVNPNKTIKYIHDGLNTNADSFTYQIDDGNTSDIATVNITVKATGGGGGATGELFSISTNSYYNPATDGEGACGFVIDNTAYHDGAFLQPTLGDNIYTDINKTIAFAGGDRYWHITGGISIRILNTGEVVGYWVCGAGEA
jgi:hypothetical protein